MMKSTFLSQIKKSGNSWIVRIPFENRGSFKLDGEVRVTIDDAKKPDYKTLLDKIPYDVLEQYLKQRREETIDYLKWAK